VSDRSTRAEVKNPLLKLRSAEQIRDLPPETRQALAALLRDLSRDARQRAERSWRQNKAPMTVYWKAVSVYAGHLSRVLRPQSAGGGPPARLSHRGAGPAADTTREAA
jgi:hypothetical protein